MGHKKNLKKFLALFLSAACISSTVFATGFAYEEDPVSEEMSEEAYIYEDGQAEETLYSEEQEAEEETEEVLSKPETVEKEETQPEEVVIGSEGYVENDTEETEDILRRSDVTDESFDEEESEDDGIVTFDTMYFVNPVYEGIISESDLDHTESGSSSYGISTFSSTGYAETLEDAAEDMRYSMEMRETPFTIKYIYPGTSIDSAGLTEIMWDLWDVAFAHTGVSTEGDYMRWQYGGWSLSASYAKGDGFLYLNMNFNVTYYTTYEQEQAVTSTLNSVMASLDLGCKNDYERVKAVYDYICSNITYDYDNLYDSSYMTKFTAYGALCDGTAVCQGYAVLLYRMLLEAGVDCRVITGTGNGGAHAWNIIGLEGKYYNVDSTWDAGRKNYSYFLLPDASFTSHTRGSDYSSSAFYAAYPMATTAYDASSGSTESHHTPGDWIVVKEPDCVNEGLRQKVCTVCDEVVEEEVISAYGHEYMPETAEPNCEKEGFVVMVCERCEDTYIDEIIPANGHDYTAEVTEPTCTKGGYTTYTCKTCGDTYEGNHTDAAGHDWETHEDPANCTEGGKITTYCRACGYSYTSGITDPDGHSYENGVCIVCGEEEPESEEEPEHSHHYETKEQISNSCGTSGYIIYQCECGDRKQVTLPATGEHSYSETSRRDATCSEHGLVTYTCLFCHQSEYTEELPLTDHLFDSPSVTKNPECTEPGIIGYECVNCEHSFEDEIPALGHEPVMQSDGSWVCVRCGAVVTEAPEPEETEPEETEPEETETEPELTPFAEYDITEAVITGIEESYPYTGEEVMPEPVVVYNGRELVKDVDYILVYAHDVEIGYASVSVIGIGEFTGEVTFHYTIETVEHGDTPDTLPDAESEPESESESESETEPVTEETEPETKQTDKETEKQTEKQTEKKSDTETEKTETEASEGTDETEKETEKAKAAEVTVQGESESETETSSETETETETENDEKGEPVQTGDDTPMAGYLMISLIAFAIFIAAFGYRKKRSM